jgi:hypothetical protein
MNFLCKNLKLTITRDEAQIQLRLRDDINMEEVELCYEVTVDPEGKNRRYYLREAMVIAMRRLVGAALEKGLISDYPGEYTILSSGTKVDPPITFSTDGDSWSP